MTEHIDRTPTWRALMPAMLAAYANMTRQMRADGMNLCHDPGDSGWCDVHDASFSEDTNPARGCRVRSNPARRGQWSVDLIRAIHDTEAEFARMAQAADRWNEHVQHSRSAAGEEI